MAQYTLKREEYLWESLQFFSYCKGLFPCALPAAKPIPALVTAWVALGQFASQQNSIAQETFNEAKKIDPALDPFFEEWFKANNNG